MRNDGYALAKHLEEQRIQRDNALMSASDPVLTVVGMPYCWKCSQGHTKPIKVEMMREKVVNGVHYMLVHCHGEESRMEISNKELLIAQGAKGSISPGWAFKPPEEQKQIS